MVQNNFVGKNETWPQKKADSCFAARLFERKKDLD